jgi:hypothetical protein
MKKLLLLLLITSGLFALEGTMRVDEVLRQLTKQYESDQAAKSKLEREKFELDAKTTQLNNQKTIKEILQPAAILKVNDEFTLFLLASENTFVRLNKNQSYKDIKITSINEHGFFYEFEGDKGYLPLLISSKVEEKTN